MKGWDIAELVTAGHILVALVVLCLFTLWVGVWQVRQLTLGLMALGDYHMRVQVQLHQELCRMNDRFTPVGGPPPPPPAPSAALSALRGGQG